MNFVFISPNFPRIYSHFVKALHDRGVNVLGIGDERYETLNDELKANLTEYCYEYTHDLFEGWGENDAPHPDARGLFEDEERRRSESERGCRPLR